MSLCCCCRSYEGVSVSLCCYCRPYEGVLVSMCCCCSSHSGSDDSGMYCNHCCCLNRLSLQGEVGSGSLIIIIISLLTDI